MGHFGSLNWLLWNFPKIFSLDFSDIVPDSSHWKEDQSDCCAFERKILIIPGMEKQVVFGLIINFFELFSKYPHYVFLKLYIMPDVKKWPKVTLFGLWRKIQIMFKIGNKSNFRTGGPLWLRNFCTCNLALSNSHACDNWTATRPGVDNKVCNNNTPKLSMAFLWVLACVITCNSWPGLRNCVH